MRWFHFPGLLAAFLSAACGSPDRSQSQQPPVDSIADAAPPFEEFDPPWVQPFADAHNWVLHRSMVYRILTSTDSLVVPAGFVTDFASIPAGHPDRLSGHQGGHALAGLSRQPLLARGGHGYGIPGHLGFLRVGALGRLATDLTRGWTLTTPSASHGSIKTK